MKIKISVLFVLSLMFFSTGIYTQWVTVSIGTTKHLNSIHSPNINYVYAVGDSGYIRVSSSGGSVYTDRSINLFVKLNSVEGFNSNTVYVCGDQGVIFKSTNAGVNWVGIAPGITTLNYMDLDFINASTGIVVGQQRRFAYTVNGGTNWISGQMNTPGSLNLNSTCVQMTDSTTFFVASSDTLISGFYYSYIYRSTNSGVTFTNNYTHSSTTRTGFIDMQFINQNTGFAASTNGTILKTTNGGNNWSIQSAIYTTQIKTFFFANDLTGYAVGDNYTYKKTTNGGANWYLQNSAANIVMNDNFFNNVNEGYVAGNGGYIMKTATGGGSFVGINQNGTEIPNTYSLSQNYPNPFNPTTNISFDIPSASNVNLRVYNILGAEVKVLANLHLSAGKYDVQFDASELPSGTYFYRLTSSNFSETKKMILIK